MNTKANQVFRFSLNERGSSVRSISQFAFESFVENGWEEGVDFGGGFGLEGFECFDLASEAV
jgi:hypothetical protein